MKNNRLFLFVSILLISWGLSAQETYNLQKVLEIGLNNNYDIRIARNEEKISSNNKTIGNAGFLPSVDLSASYNGTNNKTKYEYADGTTDRTDYLLNQNANIGLNLSWTIFDGFKIQTNYERLKEFQKMGEITTRLTIERLMADLTAEYYNYIRQTLRYANLKQALDLSKERLRIVEARYSIGSMSRLELQQTRVYFNADSSNLIKQFEVVNTSAIILNQLMALPDVSQEILIPDSIIEPNLLLDKDFLWMKTLEANTSLLLAEENKTLSELDLKTYQSQNYPYLRLNGGYGYHTNLYENSTYKKQNVLGFNYGVTLGFDVFNGFNRRREQKNAKIQIQNKVLEKERLELSLKADLSNMWMAYQNNIQLIKLEKENLTVAKENYEIAMERYMLGDLSGIDLREAQNSLLEAQESLLESQFNTKLCEISLLQISGSITSYLE
ncbi:TolC family protein [Bacteroidales bacterium OttesenSCG-928-M11]|nr:TolC family protein [Bacteroidales bacterium OttesenSCG-928-M11]